MIGRLERLIEGKLQERLREVADKSRRLDAQLASAESQQGTRPAYTHAKQSHRSCVQVAPALWRWRWSG